jgi:5-methylcytosine-specific restriction endonuclease McrA
VSVYIPAELRRQVRAAFDNCCAYCKTAEHLTVAIFEIEHIVPRALGGPSELGNLCLACPTCNRYKSDRVGGVRAGESVETPLFHPHRDDWKQHFAWNDEHTQLIGLTKKGELTIELLRMNRSQLIRVRRMWVAMDEHPPKA